MERRDRDDESVVVRTVVADRIDHVGAICPGRSVDRCGIAEERAQVLHAGQRAAARMEDPQYAVDRLDDVAVPDAESLGLDRELIAPFASRRS